MRLKNSCYNLQFSQLCTKLTRLSLNHVNNVANDYRVIDYFCKSLDGKGGGGYRLLGDIDMFTCIDAGERGSASVCLIIQQYTVPHIVHVQTIKIYLIFGFDNDNKIDLMNFVFFP